MSQWDERCGICGNGLLWWRSRSGYRVCYQCCRDPWEVLECLGRRVPGGVQLVQGWRLQRLMAETESPRARV